MTASDIWKEMQVNYLLKTGQHFWHQLEKPIIGLSPMDGVTDPCFRRMMAIHGRPDLIMTEFLSVDGICHGARNALLGLAFHKSESPVIAQLYGPRPEPFFHVAQLVCELGFDGIDINMGCPSKKVSGMGAGAALIKNAARAKAIVEATRRGIDYWVNGGNLTILKLCPEVSDWFPDIERQHKARRAENKKPIPVSIKTRIGVTQVVVKEWVSELLEDEPSAITIHGRTLKQGYRGDADWGKIAEAVCTAQGSETLILGNGDLSSQKEVFKRICETGVDGVLIGRAAMGNPWIFHRKEITRALLKQQVDSEQSVDIKAIEGITISHQERFAVALQHARLFEAMNGKVYFTGMRKHLASYCRGFEGAKALRALMVRVNDTLELESLIRDFLTAPISKVIPQAVGTSDGKPPYNKGLE